MRIVHPGILQERVAGLLHLDTQRAASGLDLTVDRILRVTGAGRVDFGGSEWAAAERQELSPKLRDSADDYGWWDLEGGSFVLRYNESVALDEGQIALIAPLERLTAAGAFHPCFLVDGDRDSLDTLLTVGEAGCHLKENCRVSRLLVLDGS